MKARHRRQAILWAVASPSLVVEALSSIGDLGVLAPGLRGLALHHGAFWPHLVGNPGANFFGQPVAMFVTYAFVHAGIVHLAINMMAFASLGRAVIVRTGGVGFGIVYGASVIGGSVGYSLLWTEPAPMVGASGAIFGLAGALLAWDASDRVRAGDTAWPILRAIAVLVAFNVVLWWALAGALAWQTHLGGFAAGWAAALVVSSRGKA